MVEFVERRVKLSVEERDKIALEDAGLVYSTGYSGTIPISQELNEEYRTIVVNKQGMGNHGHVVVVGKTPRARNLLRLGKARWLYNNGVSWPVAWVAATMHRGMELPVARLADALLPVVAHVGISSANSHKGVREWYGELPEFEGLSFPRITSAEFIAKRVFEEFPHLRNSYR